MTKSGGESIWENEHCPQVERIARGRCAAEVQARGLEQGQVWRRDGVKQGMCSGLRTAWWCAQLGLHSGAWYMSEVGLLIGMASKSLLC